MFILNNYLQAHKNTAINANLINLLDILLDRMIKIETLKLTDYVKLGFLLLPRLSSENLCAIIEMVYTQSRVEEIYDEIVVICLYFVCKFMIKVINSKS